MIVNINKSWKETVNDYVVSCFNVTDPSTGDTFDIRWNYGYQLYVGKGSSNFSSTQVFHNGEGSDESKKILYLIPARKRIDENGYVKISLSLSDPEKEDWLHKIVCFSFYDKTGKRNMLSSGLEIDHVDGNKQNNIPENLEIVPKLENLIRAFLNGYSGSQERLGDYVKNNLTKDELISWINFRDGQ